MIRIHLITIFMAAVFALVASNTDSDDTVNQPKSAGPMYIEVSTVEKLCQAVADIHPHGGTIKIKPGKYVIDQAIEIKAGLVYIEGSGWNTQITRRGDGDAIVFDNVGFCTVRDLLISGDGSAKSGSGIVYKGKSSSCTVDFCRISGFATNGIRYEGDRKSPMSSNTIRNCHFIGNLEAGIYSFNNNDFYITGNQFGTHGEKPKAGCVLDHSSAGTYTMNYHWDNINALRMGPGSHYNRIENNRFEESAEIGVVIGDPNGGDWNMYNIFTGNTFHTNSKSKSGEYPVVAAYDAHVVTFTSNQFFSWDTASYRHKNCLVIGRNCDKWIVKDNIFNHSTEAHVIYDEKINIIIKDNITD